MQLTTGNHLNHCPAFFCGFKFMFWLILRNGFVVLADEDCCEFVHLIMRIVLDLLCSGFQLSMYRSEVKPSVFTF